MRLLTALLAMLCCACTTQYQIRGVEQLPEEPTRLDQLVKDLDMLADFQARSVEDYGSFKIGIVELNDEGAFNPTQFAQVIKMVEEATMDGGVIVTFVHGWHHGPHVCDSNLACFRRVLKRVAESGRTGGRPVIGVYVGWRGESISVPGLNIGTLWTRKSVAEHIGRTGGNELLLALHRIWAKRNNDGCLTTMITVGHSLGGAFLLSAIKGSLTSEVSGVYGMRGSLRIASTEGFRTEGAEEKAWRARFGDLVVLVNPAIESAVYEPLDNDLKDRRIPDGPISKRNPPEKQKPYASDQMPIVMVVASRADGYVRWLFPVGQWVAPWTNPKVLYKASASIGLGHFGRHVTHDLTYTGKRLKFDTSGCDCIDPTEELDISDAPLDLRTARPQTFGKLTFKVNDSRLQERGWDENSPYLVVQADAGVIRNHNDIFNPVFTTFLVKYISAYAAAEEAAGTVDE